MRLQGYERAKGPAGVRNHTIILPTVFCVNDVAAAISSKVPGTRPVLHERGCGQLKPDLEVTRRTLSGIGKNPNVAAALVVGLGCEAVSAEQLADDISSLSKPVHVVSVQDVGGVSKGIELGVSRAKKLVDEVSKQKKKSIDTELTVYLHCGGSDTTSGVAANPSVGHAADRIVDEGGTIIISEVSEMIGAEHILARRAETKEIRARILEVVRCMETRAKAIGVDLRGAQPTPGNIKGGITTIEEKALGGILKGGTSKIKGVINYAEVPSGKGLYIMDSPALFAMAGAAAAGAQIQVFSTGSGSPRGSPVLPVIKVTGNRRSFEKMNDSIDIYVGTIIEGKDTIVSAGDRIYDEIMSVASGKKTKTELHDTTGLINIFSFGPTM